ncbi:hypothetical protein CJF32_00005862 [Rutstroemia sp. NJR-2017a WRK4]|nr:hypothetical protein CJF32_00005862 [Rutstroemia sp. NJR-2017a WRK4]
MLNNNDILSFKKMESWTLVRQPGRPAVSQWFSHTYGSLLHPNTQKKGHQDDEVSYANSPSYSLVSVIRQPAARRLTPLNFYATTIANTPLRTPMNDLNLNQADFESHINALSTPTQMPREPASTISRTAFSNELPSRPSSRRPSRVPVPPPKADVVDKKKYPEILKGFERAKMSTCQQRNRIPCHSKDSGIQILSARNTYHAELPASSYKVKAVLCNFTRVHSRTSSQVGYFNGPFGRFGDCAQEGRLQWLDLATLAPTKHTHAPDALDLAREEFWAKNWVEIVVDLDFKEEHKEEGKGTLNNNEKTKQYDVLIQNELFTLPVGPLQDQFGSKYRLERLIG